MLLKANEAKTLTEQFSAEETINKFLEYELDGLNSLINGAAKKGETSVECAVGFRLSHTLLSNNESKYYDVVRERVVKNLQEAGYKVENIKESIWIVSWA